MRIALDAMGGDFAPGPNVVGALEAVERNPKLEIRNKHEAPNTKAESPKLASDYL